METKTLINHPSPSEAKPLLAIAYPEHLEIIRKRFPVSLDIEETECKAMTNGNFDRLLFRKEFYNEYCLVEIHKGSRDFGITLFKSDWKSFEKIEGDFIEGFSFKPKDKAETFVLMNVLV